MNDAVQGYINAHSKSHGVGFLLTLLFGPLGLFYSSWVAALILCVIALASATTIVGPVICWLLAMMLGPFGVGKHNDKVRSAAALGVRN